MGFLDFFTGDQPPLVKGALDDVCTMLDTGRDMFATASAHLLDNEILEIDLHARHQYVAARVLLVRRAVLEHLNLDPKRELVLCLKLVSVVHEVECIGEMSVMMGRAATFAEGPRFGPMIDSLREIRSQTVDLFDDARDAFLNGDQTKARALLARQLSVNSSLVGIFYDLAARDAAANESMVYTMAAVTLERTGIHLANIGTIVTAPFTLAIPPPERAGHS